MFNHAEKQKFVNDRFPFGFCGVERCKKIVCKRVVDPKSGKVSVKNTDEYNKVYLIGSKANPYPVAICNEHSSNRSDIAPALFDRLATFNIDYVRRTLQEGSDNVNHTFFIERRLARYKNDEYRAMFNSKKEVEDFIVNNLHPHARTNV